MERKVLVVRVPDRAEIDQKTMRDYIVESLRMGVLVIGQGVAYKIEDMTDLGGVLLFGGTVSGRSETIFNLPIFAAKEDSAKDSIPTVPESGTKPDDAPTVLREKNVKDYGDDIGEKRRIRERMELYRKTNGLGCWKALDKAIKSKRISEGVIRQIYLGEITVPLEDWRMIDRGLTKLGVPIPDEKGASDG